VDTEKQEVETKKTFEPLEIMGIFWIVFGIIVLIATFFVRANPLVPLLRGVVTNIIAGVLLFGAGIACFLKGRANKLKKLKNS
jgi:predicted metal-binding membrane protein